MAFGAFGVAAGRQGQFHFDAWRISLAEAMAKAGGVNDAQGDPAAVFLYRGEMREVAERLGIDCSKFSGPIIPVIYNLNLRDPAGFFLAANFEVRNKDVIFIANATSVEVTKFLTFLRTIMATINDPIDLRHQLLCNGKRFKRGCHHHINHSDSHGKCGFSRSHQIPEFLENDHGNGNDRSCTPLITMLF